MPKAKELTPEEAARVGFEKKQKLIQKKAAEKKAPKASTKGKK